MMWGWILENPAANATPPRMSKPDLSPPNADEVGELIGAAGKLDVEFGHFLFLSATTGARRGEMCALRWHDVDLEAGTVTIERSIIDLRGGGFSEKDTKTHSSRRIALDEASQSVLVAQRHLATARATSVGLRISDDSYIFSREPDGSAPWLPNWATQKFIQIRDHLGYERMRNHDLRHFAATSLIAAGVPVRTVSGRLGHANPSTTLMVYSHFVEASDQEAARIMGKLVSPDRSNAAAIPLSNSRSRARRPTQGRSS
jgi:integrase